MIDVIKKLGIENNVSIRVLDEHTGECVQEYTGHNSATNSMLLGIAHHLLGDNLARGVIDPIHDPIARPGYNDYVPKYISLGTMGLMSNRQDAEGLPIDLGDLKYDKELDAEVDRLTKIINQAKKDIEAAEKELEKYKCILDCEACKDCENCQNKVKDAKKRLEDAQKRLEDAQNALNNLSQQSRFEDYIRSRPGYGADGYGSDWHNNFRKVRGLGVPYTSYSVNTEYRKGDLVSYEGKWYECIKPTSGRFNPGNWKLSPNKLAQGLTGYELVSTTFPRSEISYRMIIPENKAEFPKTIDVVLSAMISTGALKQFRGNNPYIFISEIGLWSMPYWNNSGENGLLAAYRLMPANKSHWNMSIPENRKRLQKSILKVKRNQIVQVVWRLQLSAVDTLDIDRTHAPQVLFNIMTDNQHIRLGHELGEFIEIDANIVVMGKQGENLCDASGTIKDWRAAGHSECKIQLNRKLEQNEEITVLIYDKQSGWSIVGWRKAI